MAEFKLTQAQSLAVSDRSGTLLVAAAAGSGKTAILTRRIIEKLSDADENGDISQYLIVTFTKAATAELRERLYKGLSEYVRANPGNKRARRQLSLIGLAKISTIHSFCLDIIRTNFQALSLPSTLRMGEETEVNVLMKNTLDRLISEKYEQSDDGHYFLRPLKFSPAQKVMKASAKLCFRFIKSSGDFPSRGRSSSLILTSTVKLKNQTKYLIQLSADL